MQLTNYLAATAVWTTVAAAAAMPAAQPAGSLKMDFTVLRGNTPADAQKHKRAGLVPRADADGSAELELENESTYYSAELSIGSNSQKNQVLVDTGSSDLWIMASNVQCSASSYSKRSHVEKMRNLQLLEETFEQNRNAVSELLQKRDDVSLISFSEVVATSTTGSAVRSSTKTSGYAYASTTAASYCTAMGALNTDTSDTFSLNSTAPDFSISYADGTYAYGYWGTDTVSFNGHQISNLSFAVVDDTDSNFGVLGIGLAGLEVTYSGGSTSSYKYENFPMKLKREGIIKKNIYSLYLNDQDSSTGSVLFGAVDHAKYSGTLETVPIINVYSSYYSSPIRLDVVLNSISLGSSSENTTISTSSIAALLDSGTTLSYFPTAILQAIVESLKGTYSKNAGLYVVDCAYNTDSAYLTYVFSGIEIKVPLSDMILTSGKTCYLGASLSTTSSSSFQYAVLGDNFLRNAYVVYDLDDLEISMAQVNYTDAEDIEVISSTISSASDAPGYSSTSLSSVVSGSSSGLTTSGLKKSGASKNSVVASVAAMILGVGIFAIL